MESDPQEPVLSLKARKLVQIQGRLAQIADLERFAATNPTLKAKLKEEKADLMRRRAELEQDDRTRSE